MPPFSSSLADLLLPPASLATLAVLVLLFRRGRVLGWLLVVVLAILSMAAVTMPMLASLDPPPWDGSGPPPGAIVILSGDEDRTADPQQFDVGGLTLERERAGAALARRTGLPVLVTGGIIYPEGPPIGVLMARSMEADFGVPARWTEDRSATTWENATFSAAILRAAGIGRVYLVTHAWHMQRSLLSFERAGLDPVPAPVRRDPWPLGTWREFLPRTSSWQRAYYAIHEWVGLVAYRMRG